MLEHETVTVFDHKICIQLSLEFCSPTYLPVIIIQNMMAFFITGKKKKKKEDRFLFFVILSFILCDQVEIENWSHLIVDIIMQDKYTVHSELN